MARAKKKTTSCKCGDCNNCWVKKTKKESTKFNSKIKKCPTPELHLHPDQRKIKESNPVIYAKLQSGEGVIAKIMTGPKNIHCPNCLSILPYYLIDWRGSDSVKSWLLEENIPSSDLSAYLLLKKNKKRHKKRGAGSTFAARNEKKRAEEEKRADAEEELPQQQPQRKRNGGLEEEKEEEESIQQLSEELVNFFTEKSEEFCAARKMRGKTLPADLVPPEAIQKYQEKECHDALHSADVPGITCVDLQKKFILTGGLDKTIVLFNIETETIENTFKGHQERINAICLHPDLQTIVSGSQDSQIRIWSANESFAHFAIGIHDSAITGLSLHPTRDHVLCTYEDCHMSLIDINVGRSMIKVPTGEDDITLNCGQFHPDGLLFGTGAKSSTVKIWDIKEQNYVAEFSGHQDSVCTISFSENGYYLATGSLDGEVKIWDLRKHKNLKTLVMNNTKTAVKSLTFDKSGAYLAVAGANVQVFEVKKWNKIAQFDGHSQMVTGVRFGDDAKFIASGSLDKTVRIYTTAEQE